MIRTRAHAAVAGALLTALVLSACTGEREEPPDEATTPVEPDPGADDEADADQDQDEPDEDEATDPDSNGPGTEPVDQADLPGEPIDLFAAGDTLDVVGVAHDDVLYVRELPDPGAAEVTSLAPMTQDLVITGRAQQIEGQTIWLELEVQEQVGWSSLVYLAYLGLVTDETSQIGDPGPQSSMTDLATAVVEVFMGEEDGPEPEITVVEDVQERDLVTIVLDVQGYADDSINGHRLHLFADTDAEGAYVLDSVEATQICLRGTSEEGCL